MVVPVRETRARGTGNTTGGDAMKHVFVLTGSQRMALCTLLLDYQLLVAPALQEFIDCSVEPAVTTAPGELLAIFMLSTNVTRADAA
jgi:hypothetical protein